MLKQEVNILNSNFEALSLALQQAILATLLQCPNCKLNALFNQLKQQKLLHTLDSNPEQNLFKQNFLVMNALFNLQHDAKALGYSLTIESINIKLVKCQENQVTNHNPALSEYYLDFNNIAISNDEISQLLDNFWQYYAEHSTLTSDDLTTAFNTLGLARDANLKQVKRAWYKIALASHPDKQANQHTSDYIKANHAYQLLVKHFTKSK